MRFDSHEILHRYTTDQLSNAELQEIIFLLVGHLKLRLVREKTPDYTSIELEDDE